MENNLDMLLDKYEQKFGESFPLMLCRGMADEDICEIVQDCIDKEKTYSPDLDPNADY